MLNYVRAELWKISRRKAFYMLLLLLFGGMLFFAVFFSGGSYYNLVVAVNATMVTGMLAAPLLAELVSEQVAETVKNELAFGLSRSRIYLGKLFTGLLVGVGISLALLGVCLGGGWLLLSHGGMEQEREMLRIVFFSAMGAFPLWCGMLSLCHMLSLLIRSTAGWITGYYLAFFLGQPILVVLAVIFFPAGQGEKLLELMQAILMPYVLMMPGFLSGWLTWEYQVCCWGIGLGWMVVSTTIGLIRYQRMDIR